MFLCDTNVVSEFVRPRPSPALQVHQLTLVTRNVRDFEDCAISLLNPID